MSIYNYTPQKRTVIQNSTDENSYGAAILAADFKTRIIDVDFGALSDGELVVYESNQDLPFDPALPYDPDTNEYYPVGYTDRADQSYYDTDNPYTASGAGHKSFNVETTGSRWISACVLSQSAGEVIKLAVTIIDNQ